MEKIKIGFLPLYIQLYEEIGSGAKARPRLEPFARKLCDQLEENGFEVYLSPFCHVKAEFEAAIANFEASGCRAIVTWHAAYSPSLESIDVLAGTDLPLVVLDTTETYAFDPTQDPGEISYCHGIHGVMDMCSMLHQRGKAFAIAAGHIDHSDVIDRTVGYLHAAIAATSLRGSRTGSIGGSFDGMGDFLVTDKEMLDRFGVTVVYPEKGELAACKAQVTDAEVEAEIAADNARYDRLADFSGEVHERTTRSNLAVRKWIAKQNLNAWTANFREIHPDTLGLDVMPFFEACKGMARGTGYAGEGDVLTASLVGALLNGFEKSTFVEIFCPDWKGNTLLLSHMGEYNIALASGKPKMFEAPFVFTEAKNPIVAYGRYHGGKAVFMNLYRSANGFKMLISPVEMVEVADQDDRFQNKVRGWMRPEKPVADFLEAISHLGGTHHSALVYDAKVSEIEYFCDILGIPYDVI